MSGKHSLALLAQQTSTFTDDRDGREYPIINLKGTWWFQSNLRYVSDSSWCAQEPRHKKCRETNYYRHTETAAICPAGWRIPTFKDFRTAVIEVARWKGRTVDTTKWGPGFEPDAMFGENRTVFMDSISLTKDTLLNFTRHRWTEGDKLDNSPPAHVHMNDKAVRKHAHKHHVYDERHRQRRFTVRCVK